MPQDALYLIPVTLGEDDVKRVIPSYNFDLIKQFRTFIAEDAKSARRFLKLCGYGDLSIARVFELNRHSTADDVRDMMEPLLNGEAVGLMSDAGCPGVADPGAEIVKLAHRKNIRVVPLVGPSSILLSIMASGFNGQQFAFNGYLPIEKPQRIKRLKELEQFTRKYDQSQFFIETPYRNIAMFDDLLSALSGDTLLCVATDLTLADETIITKSIADWKKSAAPDMNKKPTVFGIYK